MILLLGKAMSRLGFIFIFGLLLTACYAYSAPVAEPVTPQLHKEMTFSIKHKSIPKWSPVEPLSNIQLQAKAAILTNFESGEILFDKNIDESLPIASMSKIMSELIVLEAIEAGELNWNDSITISEYAYTISNQPGYASVQLEQDKKYTVEQLFNAMAIQSANGATIALAEAASGSEKDFVTLMNDKAEELKLTETYFVNSTGLTNVDLLDFHSVGVVEDSNKMSARDLATLVHHILHHYPELLNITKQVSFDFQGDTRYNSNWMLPGTEVDWIETDIIFPGIDGLKTGYTTDAGYGFAGTVEIDDFRFISVVIGTEEIEDRFIETKILYEAIAEQM